MKLRGSARGFVAAMVFAVASVGIAVPAADASYTGGRSAHGWAKPDKPGLASLNNGQRGTWYATRVLP